MNAIDHTFTSLQTQNRKALIGYFTVGDPDFATSLATLRAACDAGLDILELGVPFSDPTCDGPVIQEASQRALANGMSLSNALALAAELRRYGRDLSRPIPIILFSYYNPIFKFGLEKFADAARNSGIDGVLVVDLPPEESADLATHLAARDIHIIRLVAPTTTPERLAMICASARGFFYVISRTGVTGTGGVDYDAVIRHAAEIATVSPVPVCVGFGISTPDDVRKLAPHVDGIIVGSAFVKLAATTAPETLPRAVYEKVRELLPR